MSHSRSVIRGLVLTIVLGAVLAPVSYGAKPPKPPAGMTYYFVGEVVAKKGSPPRVPDFAKYGGKVVESHDRTHVIQLPKAAARQLRGDEAVAFVQRIWMGESFDEWQDYEPSSGSRAVTTDDDDTNLTWTTGAMQYDGSGSIKSMGSDKYAYDSAGRVIEAIVSGETESYGYDSFGNLLKRQKNSGSVSIPVDPGSNRVNGYTYDEVGNVTARRGVEIYVYDALGMLTRMERPRGAAWRMLYTADDERIASLRSNMDDRWWIRDFNGRVMREFVGYGFVGGLWRWDKDYVYAGGRLVSSDNETFKDQSFLRRRHFHLDHLGSVRMITTENRTKVARVDYYPFGTEKTSITQEQTNFGEDQRPENLKFTGHERIYYGLLNVENTEYLDYMHARYYEPNQGRFLSVDPAMDPKRNLGAPQRWNRYAYALNNPLLRVDPDGRKDTIFIVNTTYGRGFTSAQLAALNRTVAGTRFEGNVRVIGPMASNTAMLRTVRGADSTDMVGVIVHSGRSALQSGGNIFTQKKIDAAAATGVLQGGLTGNDLAAAVNPSNPVGACVLAGCSSDQAALSMMTGANVLTFGTTNHTRLDQLGNALVSTLGAMAQGATPQEAASTGSQQLTIKPDCAPSHDCNPYQPARVEAMVPPQ